MEERIIQLLRHLHLTQAEFEREAGLGGGLMKRLIMSNGRMTSKALMNISEAFPKINVIWLQTGKGDMILSEEKQSNGSETPNELDTTEQRLRFFFDTIKTTLQEFDNILKIPVDRLMGEIYGSHRLRNDTVTTLLKYYPALNSDWLKYGRGTMIKSDAVSEAWFRMRIENQEKDVEDSLNTESNKILDALKRLEQKIESMEKSASHEMGTSSNRLKMLEKKISSLTDLQIKQADNNGFLIEQSNKILQDVLNLMKDELFDISSKVRETNHILKKIR